MPENQRRLKTPPYQIPLTSRYMLPYPANNISDGIETLT